MLAVGGNAQGRQAAEILVRRRKFKTAAKLQRAEDTPCRIAVVEGRNRHRPDIDRARRFGAWALRSGDGDGEHQRDDGADRAQPPPWRVHATTRLRRGCRIGSGTEFSSKSSASFSVIAPPSSSASTMVTARR